MYSWCCTARVPGYCFGVIILQYSEPFTRFFQNTHVHAKNVFKNVLQEFFQPPASIHTWQLVAIKSLTYLSDGRVDSNYSNAKMTLSWVHYKPRRAQYRLVQAHRHYLIQCPMSTPFARDKILKNCTRFVFAPAEPLTNGVFLHFYFFFRNFCVFVFFLKIFGSRDPTFRRKKKRKKRSDSAEACETCKKRAWTSGPLCGKRAKIMASHRNCFDSVYIGFLGLKCDLILVLRGQFFDYLREPCTKTCLGAPGSGSFTIEVEKMFLPAETPDYYWPLWRPAIGRDTFSVLAPVLGL